MVGSEVGVEVVVDSEMTRVVQDSRVVELVVSGLIWIEGFGAVDGMIGSKVVDIGVVDSLGSGVV